MKQILIAEDEPRIAAFLEKKLRANGFLTSVVEDGYETVRKTLCHNFDLLLLDIGLPGQDGITVIEDLRGQGEQLPIILLTARDDIQDKVNGLENGADDYVTKPFCFEELLARIRLRLQKREIPQLKQEKLLRAGDLVLDLSKRQVKLGVRQIKLSNQEFILLDTFLRYPDRILSRDNLLNYVWGYNYDYNSNIVDVYVGYLRKKLGSNFIETVRGIGYRFHRCN